MDKKRILVADDEPDFLQAVKTRLEANDYEVIVASDGKSCLEKVEKEKPDLIILDIMMPEIDGIEVLRRIRSSRETRYTPVIMLTCKRETDSILNAQESGGTDYTDYIMKPFDSKELLRLVKKFVL